MTTKEILLKAADLIVERGHTKHCYENGDGGLCAYGAVDMAAMGRAGRRPEREDSPHRLALMAAEKLVANGALAVWNDAPERKPEEVVALLRRAAETV